MHLGFGNPKCANFIFQNSKCLLMFEFEFEIQVGVLKEKGILFNQAQLNLNSSC